ncbi:site-specific integrase [Companilactobacillus allii]|uniref:Site-specific integrase n=1 Tax=Companilactobacillus allii TaxID=1847728 RepID=A0A1P8Q3M1_9LACO|nr:MULTISPECIES: site-specific integrase [Companilactobacillus]APX72450.1 site-specific integrase [Companilactobacillus allii]USQ69546.1 site-specific integrase [Companilactobacillus allii]WDT64751.1 site-specific integrase [Companilactobacillus crustorum]
MATITKYTLKNGKSMWRCIYPSSIDPLTNKVKRTTKRGFKTKAECQKFLNAKLSEIDNHGYSNDSDLTYKRVYEYFLESYKNTVKESTLNRVEGLFKHHILPPLGSFKIKKITTPMCQEAVNKWSNELSSFKMVKYYANLVFKEAIRLKIIYDNPMSLIVMPKKKQQVVNKPANFWTKEETAMFFDQLYKTYSDHNQKAVAMFRLLFFSGMRKGELLALQINDIDFDNKTLTINKTVSRGIDNKPIISTPKTKTSVRTIGLDSQTCSVLKKWLKELRKEMFVLGYNIDSSNDQLLFPNTYNELLSLTKINKWLQVIINTYNKNHDEKLKRINIHGIRHTACSLMLESGSSIKAVQLQLGHSDTSQIMKVYWHISNKTQMNTVNNLAKFVNF